MLRFRIIPQKSTFPAYDIIAHDASNVLTLIERLGYEAADVEVDGQFSFSARLGMSGVWSISSRNLQPVPQSQVAG